MEGVELVKAVIERVREKGFNATFGGLRDREPIPLPADMLERFRFDGDVPLTPCMKEWLAFDGWMFSCFGSGPTDMPAGQRLGALVTEQFGEVNHFEVFERTLPRLCYPLPFNDNREQLSFIYPSKPDAIGELPVLTAEDGNGYVLVGYPGIDIYLGRRARLLGQDPWTEWRGPYEGRYEEHRKEALQGQQVLELGEGEYIPEIPEEDGLPPGIEKLDATNYSMDGDGPVPSGFHVVSEGRNPFTKVTFRRLKRDS